MTRTSQKRATQPAPKEVDGEPLKEAFHSTVDEFRQKSEETGKQIAAETEKKARRLFTEQRRALAGQVEAFAKAFRDTGRNLDDQDYKTAARYSNELAGEVERFADYIREKEMTEIVDSVEDFGRRQPVLFVGSLFTAGILLARFLKSSSEQED